MQQFFFALKQKAKKTLALLKLLQSKKQRFVRQNLKQTRFSENSANSDKRMARRERWQSKLIQDSEALDRGIVH